MNTDTYHATLTTIECTCGGVYAISEKFRAEAYELGNRLKTWHCPYCQCDWGFGGKSQKQKLEDDLTRTKRALEQSQTRTREAWEEMQNVRITLGNKLRAEKGAKTRIKNRVANGVCPCCTRTFQNLHRHMETKHPEFKKESP